MPNVKSTPVTPSAIDAKDAHILINAVVKQQTGVDAMTAIDTSSFVSVGETLVRAGYESLLQSITTVIANTIFSSRPYQSSLDVMRVTDRRWGEAIRKIVPFSLPAEETTDYNTTSSTPLTDGNSVDMYKIRKRKVMQLNFYDVITCQYHYTRFRHQIDAALRNEAEFLAFWDMIMIEVLNDISAINEAKTRALLINAIAGAYAMNNYVDLAASYNARYNTQYTRAQLLSDKFESFMKYSAAVMKQASRNLRDRTARYHAQIDAYANSGQLILRHTPLPLQRMLFYGPLLTEQETTVFPTLYGPNYLEMQAHEDVNFWQSPKSPASVSATPVILDVTTGSKKKTDAVQTIPYVAGLLYDTEFMGFVSKFQYASTTPENSAGGYWNTYYHWLYQAYLDYTENHVLFVIGDGGAGQIDQSHIIIDNDSINVQLPASIAVTNVENGSVKEPLLVDTTT